LIPLKSPLINKQNSQLNFTVHPNQTSRNVNYFNEIEIEKLKTEKTQFEFKNLYEKNLDLKAAIIEKDRQIEQFKSNKNREIEKLTQKLFEKDQEIISLSASLNNSEKTCSQQMIKKDYEIKALFQRIYKLEAVKKILEEELNNKDKELIKIPLYSDQLKMENSKNNSQIILWKQKYVLYINRLK